MRMPESAPVIQAHDLRRTFGNRRGQVVEAVAGIDFEVEHGSIFGFLGPNGAGKTTTLRMLATLLIPTSAMRWSPDSACSASRSDSENGLDTSARPAAPIAAFRDAPSWNSRAGSMACRLAIRGGAQSS